MNPVTAAQAIVRRNSNALLLVVCLGQFMVVLDVSIVNVALPSIQTSLHVKESTLQWVIVAYTIYHMFETYFIVPRVYGNTLRLSTLAVLIALIVGATLQGIVGAVLILPVVAAYPIIERIWLKDYLAPEVLDDHAALEDANADTESVVDAVLQGEQHGNDPAAANHPQASTSAR